MDKPDAWLSYRRQRNLVTNEIKKIKKQYLRMNRSYSKETSKILKNSTGINLKNTEINKISTGSDYGLTKPCDVANNLNSHFVEISPKLASEVPNCNKWEETRRLHVKKRN